MLELKCQNSNVRAQMLHLKCYTTNVTTQMLLLECYSSNVTPQMLHFKCDSLNVTAQIIVPYQPPVLCELGPSDKMITPNFGKWLMLGGGMPDSRCMWRLGWSKVANVKSVNLT